MKRRVVCSCGYVVESEDDAEFYNLVRRHIIPLDYEVHRPIAGPDAITAAQLSLEVMRRHARQPLRAAG
ncbi:MAG TPA: hypothetical protein VF221_16325 [Chloroflexota bacterium]